MKEKIITIKPKGITQKQWATFLLELNIMKQQWRSYGVHLNISAPSLKKIIALGTSNGSDTTKRRSVSSRRSYEGDDSRYTNVE